MGEDFQYEHSAKGVSKRKRVVALDELVEKCLRMNGAAAAVFEVAFWLLVVSWHGWVRIESDIVVAFILMGCIALLVSVVMMVRMIAKLLGGLVRVRREISWSNVIGALVLGLVPWITILISPWVL